jgi:hypothetical protein
MEKNSVLTCTHTSIGVAKRKPNYVKNWYCSRSITPSMIVSFHLTRIIIMLQNFPIEIQFKFNGIKTKPVGDCERAFSEHFVPRSSLSHYFVVIHFFFCSVGAFFLGQIHNNREWKRAEATKNINRHRRTEDD